MADGILTPAVSVTSAAAGIAVSKPSTAGSVTGISLVSIFPSCPLNLTEDKNRLCSPPFSLYNPWGQKNWVSRSLQVSDLIFHPERVSYPGA